MSKKGILILSISLAGIALAFYASFAVKKNKQESSHPQPVTQVSVQAVIEKDTRIELEAIGNIQAYATINVKSLVDGQLEHVGFVEGEMVQKDQILFTIDKRPFEVKLQEAKAILAKDEVQLSNAQRVQERGKRLKQDKNFSQQEYDQLATNVDVLKATIEVDKAAVASAELQLEYCTIRSPVTGFAGDLRFNIGNIIQAKDATPLVTIKQTIPIYAAFSVPEQYLSAIKENIGTELAKVSILPGGSNEPVSGTLSFINNTVDTTTGTIALKATLANTDQKLWPGQFVNVKLPLRFVKNALLAPTQAISAGPEGFFVYVVDENNQAQMRPVQTGPILGEETIILSGLQKGDLVVTKGQLRLTTGALVRYDAPSEVKVDEVLKKSIKVPNAQN